MSVIFAVQVPEGCSRYTVVLSKPLGLALEEDGKGGIFVAEVHEGGNAARAEVISRGDALISTSAVVCTREAEYQGNMVRSGEQTITLNVQGEVCTMHGTYVSLGLLFPGRVTLTWEVAPSIARCTWYPGRSQLSAGYIVQRILRRIASIRMVACKCTLVPWPLQSLLMPQKRDETRAPSSGGMSQCAQLVARRDCRHIPSQST